MISSIYFMIEGDPSWLYAKLSSAIIEAKNIDAKRVLKVRITKDAIIRLHNGGGGYIESEEVVWTNPLYESPI